MTTSGVTSDHKVVIMTTFHLTHWGRVKHVCIDHLTKIVSDNGLSPGRRQAIIWTNDGTLLIGPLGRNFNEILIGIHKFSFKKMHLKMSSAKWRQICLCLNVLICCQELCFVSVCKQLLCNPVPPKYSLFFSLGATKSPYALCKFQPCSVYLFRAC